MFVETKRGRERVEAREPLLDGWIAQKRSEVATENGDSETGRIAGVRIPGSEERGERRDVAMVEK